MISSIRMMIYCALFVSIASFHFLIKDLMISQHSSMNLGNFSLYPSIIMCLDSEWLMSSKISSPTL